MKRRILVLTVIFSMLFLAVVPVYAASVTILSNKDNYMRIESPDDNQGAQTELIVGRESGGNSYRALAEFPIIWGTDIPVDAEITSATLQLYYYWYDWGDDPAGRSYSAARLLRLDWSELDSSWNSYDTGLPWTTAGAGSVVTDYTTTGVASATVPSSYGWMSWNVLSQVQWAQTSSVDAAFRIYDSVETSGSSAFFYSKEYADPAYRPRLVIQYTTPAAPAVATQAASSVTGDSVYLSGTVSDNGTEAVTTRGFKYGLTQVDTWDSHETGTFDIGSYHLTVGGLAPGTTYWYRAYAVNAIGTGYGSWMSFKTVNIPTVSTKDATYIASTTARLQGLLDQDGGAACEYRFQYGFASGVYSLETSWEGAKATGQTFYADVTGLSSDTTYYFRAQARNGAGVSNGAEKSFTTSWELLPPTQFNAHATSGTDVSLAWIKGGGSDNTLIRFRTDVYPTTSADGTQAYLGGSSSVLVSNLTPGTTFYFSAWGESAEGYSSTYAQAIATTLAGTPITIPTSPETPTGWFQIPSTERITRLPGYAQINSLWDSFELPHTTGWTMLALLIAAILGVLVLSLFPKDYTGSISAGGIWAALIASAFVCVASTWMGIISGWVLLIILVMEGTYAFIRSRA